MAFNVACIDCIKCKDHQIYTTLSQERSQFYMQHYPRPTGSLLSTLRKAVIFTSGGYYYCFTPELERP